MFLFIGIVLCVVFLGVGYIEVWGGFVVATWGWCLKVKFVEEDTSKENNV